MSVRVAESAGFCFGVSRAVELVEQAARGGKTVVTLGPIIHNHHVVDKFRALGVEVDVYKRQPNGQSPCWKRRVCRSRF